MDARMREQHRQAASQRRKAPVKAQRIILPAAELGDLPPCNPDHPIELCIEATDAEGVLAPWLCDEWWIQVRSHCRNHQVTINLLPTPGAVLDRVVRHQLEMVRRISGTWHLIAHARVQEALGEPNAEHWLATPYHEIRFCQQSGDRPEAVDAAAAVIRRAATVNVPAGFHRPRFSMVRATAGRVLPNTHPAAGHNPLGFESSPISIA